VSDSQRRRYANRKVWFQFWEFQGNGNRNQEITVWHGDITFTFEGDTFVYRDRGPDHLYVNQDGDLILTITGRPSSVFDGVEGVALSGHAVTNLDTGDRELHGNVSPNWDDQACAALVD
jgi:hypothetical protein